MPGMIVADSLMLWEGSGWHVLDWRPDLQSWCLERHQVLELVSTKS